MKLLNAFYLTCGAFLSVTLIAKLVSALGDARMLNEPDPVFSISNRKLMVLAAVIELMVAVVCFFGKRPAIKSGSLMWLASIFFAYRIGLYFLDNGKHCPCLGNLTDALHIRPETADIALKGILLYFLIGGVITSCWLRFHSKKLVANQTQL